MGLFRFEVPVEVVLPRLRVVCRHCRPKLGRLDWLEPYARVTSRLALSGVSGSKPITRQVFATPVTHCL